MIGINLLSRIVAANIHNVHPRLLKILKQQLEGFNRRTGKWNAKPAERDSDRAAATIHEMPPSTYMPPPSVLPPPPPPMPSAVEHPVAD